MNIFMMLLVILFMAGYYFISAPSQTITKQETSYAVNYADLRSVVECASAAHTAVIKDIEFNNICMQKYLIESNLVCLNEGMAVVNCDINKTKKPEFNYIVTATGILPESQYNNILEILNDYYPNANTFGVLMDGYIISGSNNKKRIPDSILKDKDMENGQLVYMTQFDIPDVMTQYIKNDNKDIVCGVGTIKTYRFSRWQCIPLNEKTNCPGDTFWDADVSACVANDNKKPLCTGTQTAVMVDDVWECIDPYPERQCPNGQSAKLNYSNLTWECIDDPNAQGTTKVCDNLGKNIVYSGVGATLQLSSNSCTDCEKIVIDTDTCKTSCIPDTSRLSDPKCYANANDCNGANRGFYFGFPDSNYAANISALSEYNIPFDAIHSRNRMFNCIDCGTGEIDNENSLSPYITVCK